MGDFEKFYNIALRFLSYRPRSEKEVKDKLKRKKIDQTMIDRVINKLKEQKFINDEEFAKWWIEQRTNFKPRSLRLIKIELRQKGIEQDLIDSLINDLRLMNNDLEQAKKLIEKRIERFRDLSKQEIYQKLGSYLARRGFDWDIIKQVIDPD
jgi:regulatory protein